MESLRDSGIARALNEDSGVFGTFVILHRVAWGKRDLKTIFHDHLVRRDSPEDPAHTVKVLRWVQDDDNIRSLYARFNISSILIRKDYVDLLLDILLETLGEPPEELLAPRVDRHVELSDRLLDYLSSDMEQGAAIIIGTLGIGKSLFMYFVLALRVLAGLPTVFQLYKDYICIINHEGVFCVDYPIGAKPLVKYVPDGTWILVDSDDVPGVPSELRDFSACIKGFVLQATTFKRDRLRWSWKMRSLPRELWMTPWTLEELIQARDLQHWTRLFCRPSEQDLSDFCTKYGYSARFVYGCNGRRNRMESVILREATTLISEIRATFEKNDLLVFEKETFNFTIIGAPNPFDRQEFTLSIASEYLTDYILSQLKITHQRATSRLYWLFINNRDTHPCAGYLLRRLALETFPQGGQWEVAVMEKEDMDNDGAYWRSRAGSPRRFLCIDGGRQIISVHTMQKEGPFRPLPRILYTEDHHDQLISGFYSLARRSQRSSEIFVYNAALSYATVLQPLVSASESIPTVNLDRLAALGATTIDLVMVTDPRDTMDVYVTNSQRLRHVYHLVLRGDAQ